MISLLDRYAGGLGSILTKKYLVFIWALPLARLWQTNKGALLSSKNVSTLPFGIDAKHQVLNTFWENQYTHATGICREVAYTRGTRWWWWRWLRKSRPFIFIELFILLFCMIRKSCIHPHCAGIESIGWGFHKSVSTDVSQCRAGVCAVTHND